MLYPPLCLVSPPRFVRMRGAAHEGVSAHVCVLHPFGFRLSSSVCRGWSQGDEGAAVCSSVEIMVLTCVSWPRMPHTPSLPSLPHCIPTSGVSPTCTFSSPLCPSHLIQPREKGRGVLVCGGWSVEASLTFAASHHRPTSMCSAREGVC